MSEDHKRQLEQQLWNIANTLRGKMNADEFRDYILGFIFYKYLSEKKSKAMEKARAAPEKPSGKQTVRQLIGQNQGVSNIEITNSNIKGFERIARKYGVDFAVKKDRSVSPPKYFVFFKARDADALTAAFKEYTAYELKRAAKAQNRPSVLAHLQALKAKVQAITPGKSRNQNRGITI